MLLKTATDSSVLTGSLQSKIFRKPSHKPQKIRISALVSPIDPPIFPMNS